MKARTDVKQDTVQYQAVGDTDYIRLYVHETEGVDEIEQDGEIISHPWYEYDFKEIAVPTGTLDIDEVKTDPESYLDYEPVAPATIEDLQTAILALQEMMMES